MSSISNHSLLKFVLLLQFLTLAFSACLDSDEPDGSCTKCSPVQFLEDGHCYSKIRGCLKHLAGPLCVECQSGYVLDKGACIREAVFLGNMDLDPSPVTIEKRPALPYSKIRDRLGEKYGSEFPKVHKYLLQEHPQLGVPKVVSVDILVGKIQAILKIEYQTSETAIYRSFTVINNNNQIEQISFSLGSENVHDLLQINSKIVSSVEDLSGYDFYGFKQGEENYEFKYINQERNFITVTLAKADAEKSDIEDSLQIENSDIFDEAQREILKLFPQLADKPRSAARKAGEDLYLLQFGESISVSVQYKEFQFLINTPVQKTSIEGEFLTVEDRQAPDYLSALNFVLLEFPQLTPAKIINAESLVSSQTVKFKLYFLLEESSDQFTVLVSQHPESGNLLLAASKNGNLIFMRSIDYNNDEVFMQAYPLIRSQSKVVNIPPISSVSKKIIGDLTQYRVEYSENQHAVLEYDAVKKTVKLLSYIQDGQNLLKIVSSPLRDASVARSQQVLFNFLKKNKPQAAKGKLSRIHFDEASLIYDLRVVTSSGSFLATMQDINGTLELQKFEKVSNGTCYELAYDFIQSNQKIKFIDSFLMEHYPLQGFSIQLIQADVGQLYTSYRFLYASSRLKQIQISLREAQAQAKVTKASVINYGYQILNPEPKDPNFLKILNILKSSNLSGDLIPFYSQLNSTNIRSYYNDGEETLEILIDKEGTGGKGYVIDKRKFKLVPDGFDISNLIYVEKASTQQLEKIYEILLVAEKKFYKFMAEPIIKFLEKSIDEKGQKYKFFVKTPIGYAKFFARWVAGEQSSISVGNLVLTEDKDEDFSNCRAWNDRGKCLSCDQNQISYQGGCFSKMEGCLIQPGSICVRCNSNYVRSGLKCFRECSKFFI